MSVDEMKPHLDGYQARFGNLIELVDASIICDPRLANLLDKAVAIGKPLTRKDIQEVFPGTCWNW